jgi:hypothetical protein
MAVVSAVSLAADPRAATRELVDAWRAAGRERDRVDGHERDRVDEYSHRAEVTR